MTGSVLRNLLRTSAADALTWIDSDDATRNAMFGYVFGRLRITGGDANSIQATLLHPDGLTALQDGAVGWIVPEAPNTGPMEVDIAGLGAVAFRDRIGAAFAGGELAADRAAWIGYYDNGTDPAEFRLLSSAGGQATKPVGVQLITATGDYTPTTGTTHVLAIGQGAGGGGGGSGNTPTMAGNGGPGETRLGIFEVSGVVAVTVGAGGAGGSAGSNNGSGGGDLAFGSNMTAKGGLGGTAGTADAVAADGTTPTGSGGIALLADLSQNLYDTGNNEMWQRTAGTIFGQGSFQGIFGATATATGKDGRIYGVAGMGAFKTGSTNMAGGDGGPACLLLIEFGQ